ncbi:hypothetical protein [Calothrix sp. UHCC 0171]|uniref:hypothetical protein n=1 Tax=Calothrix sp. UHCC 0171 TaxID=3110245 RepID=UPI002B1F5EDC|nr:hypothetical protein [Calothrix sp. UHCC 0171]MEA5571094.1 hypothetical protein [Calothrix sp. UHCC 0171]
MKSKFLQNIVILFSLATGIFSLTSFSATAETISNKAADLQIPTNSSLKNTTTSSPQPTVVAQQTTPAISPGTATRGGPSYIGVGGNIGLGGDTALSEGGFSVISKIGLTRNFSLRPSAVIGDNTVFLVPVTVDFPVESVTDTGTQRISVAPYLGAGVAIATGDDTDVGFLLTGGVDVPVSPQFTANAAINVGFIDDTEVGLSLGIGYNF